MTIQDIQAALSSKAKTMNIQPTVHVSPKRSAAAPVNQAVPAVPKPSTVKNPAPVTVIPAKVEQKPAELETKPASVTPKKATTRRTKAATVIPIDGIEAVIAKHLKVGIHYDTIPGCGRKPVLLKAGAEKLAEIYGYRTTSEVINRIERFDQLFVLYEVQTTVYGADGNIVAEGLGSCNSKERRYQKGDFAGHLNTVLKMAKKRSYVDAALSATHASGVFTQDIEDIAVYTRLEAIG